MLERAAERIAAAAAGHDVPGNVRLVQADLFEIPPHPSGYTTILGLGLTHLFDDVPAVIGALRQALASGGHLHVAGLVAETRRGRRYLELLHRAGEVGVPRTAEELRTALGRPSQFSTIGCMAYATLGA